MYENKCSETIKTAFSKSNDNKKCAYYVFETVETSYDNKLGKLVNYNRYAHVDKKATINELIELLQECATRYLQYQYYISCDNVFWSKFKSSSQHPILHFDYSENIQFTTTMKPKVLIFHILYFKNDQFYSYLVQNGQETFHKCSQQLD